MRGFDASPLRRVCRMRGEGTGSSTRESGEEDSEDEYGRSLAVPGTPMMQHFPLQKR